jgi:hypothetical protein
MGATDKLKWQRLLNELRYQDEEYDLTCQVVKEVAPEFEEHYRDFCGRENIDRESLNKSHADRLEGLYGPGATPAKIDMGEAPAAQAVTGALIRSADAPDVVGFDETTAEYIMTSDELELHDLFNKLFRKLAMILHPDKLSDELPEVEKKIRRTKFDTAKDALDKHKYFILLQIADEYNIKIPRNYRQQSRWMKKEIEKIKYETHKRKSTYNYLFANADTDEEKDVVIRKFINQLFGIKI